MVRLAESELAGTLSRRAISPAATPSRSRLHEHAKDGEPALVSERP